MEIWCGESLGICLVETLGNLICKQLIEFCSSFKHKGASTCRIGKDLRAPFESAAEDKAAAWWLYTKCIQKIEGFHLLSLAAYVSFVYPGAALSF